MTIKLTFYSLAIIFTDVKSCINLGGRLLLLLLVVVVVQCDVWVEERVVAFILVIADGRCYQAEIEFNVS